MDIYDFIKLITPTRILYLHLGTALSTEYIWDVQLREFDSSLVTKFGQHGTIFSENRFSKLSSLYMCRTLNTINVPEFEDFTWRKLHGISRKKS